MRKDKRTKRTKRSKRTIKRKIQHGGVNLTQYEGKIVIGLDLIGFFNKNTIYDQIKDLISMTIILVHVANKVYNNLHSTGGSKISYRGGGLEDYFNNPFKSINEIYTNFADDIYASVYNSMIQAIQSYMDTKGLSVTQYDSIIDNIPEWLITSIADEIRKRSNWLSILDKFSDGSIIYRAF